MIDAFKKSTKKVPDVYESIVGETRSYLINGHKPLRDRRFALLPFQEARIYCFSKGVRQRNPCLTRPSPYL